MNQKQRSDLEATISQALEEMKEEQGSSFSIDKVNLAELGRRTGISRKRLRKIQKDGFVIKDHALKGTHHGSTVLTGYTALIDDMLRKNNRNSNNIMDILVAHGYSGGLTQVKEYVEQHLYLMPAKREIVSPQGNRGRRYHSGPGENYQMDWGFVNVDIENGKQYRAACFVMICHHCGERYVEFFPNAKQENLFIGMIHAFQRMGVPKYILTDNMKSVVTGRDSEGKPIWNKDYEAFMRAIGFQTKLCKPRHPFTKGKVERLVRFVKNNFMAGRPFSNITELNYDVLSWCDVQNKKYHKGVYCVPDEKHSEECMKVARPLQITKDVLIYLWPERKISFDGFINFEGRRFGVPYWYPERVARVSRQEYILIIRSDDLSRKLAEHDVTWAPYDSFCKDQYADEQPEEFPTAPITTQMHQREGKNQSRLGNFNFDKEVEM